MGTRAFLTKAQIKKWIFLLRKTENLTISISVNCLERMSLCCLEQVKFCVQNLRICPHLEKGPLQMRLIILRWGHPWLSEWAPNPLRNILIKREDTVTEEKAMWRWRPHWGLRNESTITSEKTQFSEIWMLEV